MTLNYWKDLHHISLQTASHTFDEESDQSCKAVKCMARHRKLPGETQDMRNAAVHGIGDEWLEMLDIREEAHHETNILLKPLLA